MASATRPLRISQTAASGSLTRPESSMAPDPRSLSILREFMEHLTTSRPPTRAAEQRHPAEVDWDNISTAAEGASSLEVAVGRIVVAGYVAARGIGNSGRTKVMEPHSNLTTRGRPVAGLQPHHLSRTLPIRLRSPIRLWFPIL